MLLNDLHAQARERWLQKVQTWDSAMRTYRHAMDISDAARRQRNTAESSWSELPAAESIRTRSRAAFCNEEHRPNVRTTESPLTAREREVAALVAQGLTNDEISNALVITRGTTANHVRHILCKLGVRSRIGVAVWCIERDNSLLSSIRTDRIPAPRRVA